MTMQNIVNTAFNYAGKEYKRGDVFEPLGHKNDRSIIERLCKAKFIEQEELTVREMRDILKERGLPIHGNKSELAERLKEADKNG